MLATECDNNKCNDNIGGTDWGWTWDSGNS